MTQMPQQEPNHSVWRYLSWPNRISLLRLLLIPPFVILMLNHRQHDPLFRYLALGIFALMAISDFLDGFLARRMHLTSKLGAILDPIADKALIICSAILLALPESAVGDACLPNWVVVLIVGKDVWVMAGFIVIVLLTRKLRVQPNIFGKMSTAGQLAMVIAILISPELNGPGGHAGTILAQVLWSVVAGLCVLAAASYTRMGLRFVVADMKRHETQESS
jgi:CDP-diacylglycerol--glycerol-3-phosphate 3-phosphatidyltransferase